MLNTYRMLFFIGMLCAASVFGCTLKSEESVPLPVESGIRDQIQKGEIEGIPIPLGATKKEVLDQLGNPIRSGNSECGFTFYYEGFSLEFEDYADSIDQLNETSQVVLLSADSKTVGLTGSPDEIKGILGTPSREILDDTGDGTFILEYAGNDYICKIIFATPHSPAQYMVLQIK